MQQCSSRQGARNDLLLKIETKIIPWTTSSTLVLFVEQQRRTEAEKLNFTTSVPAEIVLGSQISFLPCNEVEHSMKKVGRTTK